MLYNFLL